MPTIPPSGPPTPDPSAPSPHEATPPPLSGGGGGKGSLSDFLSSFTPEEKKKFDEILMKNLISAMSKASKKYIEELRKEREELQ